MQFNFPGAENEDKETDGEMKLYPPIDDFSDEDHGVPTNIRAKVSFGLTPESAQKKIPQNLQNLISSNSDPNSKNKAKKPLCQNKNFVFDEKLNSKSKPCAANLSEQSVE